MFTFFVILLLLLNYGSSMKIFMNSMNFNKRNVVVIGSTGKTGYQIVKALTASDDASQIVVTAACRDLSKGRLLYGPDDFNKLVCVPMDIAKDNSERMTQIFENVDSIVIASGAIGLKDSFNIDNIGNKKIIDAAIKSRVKKIVLITSLLTSGMESGQLLNPQFILLNLFGGLLLNKRQAELYLEEKKNDIDWTIIRPGGLSNVENDQTTIKIAKQNTFFNGSISRSQVADVVVNALLCKNDEAKHKIFEIVSSKEPFKNILESFKNI
jgi:nucleoside-diphosphate-sugar epimerase